MAEFGQYALVLSLLPARTPLALLPGQPWARALGSPARGLPLFPLAGLPSHAAWALARHDLALIRRGRMDPAGEGAVWDGRWFGAAGVVSAALSVVLSTFLGMCIYRVY